ncbi:hypothetical protein L209DRAFT_397908 [Thermothelomyces heterothallicus CBS 203.75]
MPPTFIQSYLGGQSGSGPNPQKLLAKRKGKANAVQDTLVSVRRVGQDLAADLNANCAAVQSNAADVVQHRKRLEEVELQNKQSKKETTEVLQSSELKEFLANPDALPELAGSIPDAVGRQLLEVVSAYLGTEAFADMAVSHSQGVADHIAGPAAAQLARHLEALRIDHDRVVQEHKRTVQALEADVTAAKQEAATNRALAAKTQLKLIQLKAEVSAVQNEKGKALAALQEAAKRFEKQADDMSRLEKVNEQEVQERAQLSRENERLTALNDGLAEQARLAREKRDKARRDHLETARKLRDLRDLMRTDKELLQAEIDKQCRIIDMVQGRADAARSEHVKREQEIEAKMAEETRLREAAEAELGCVTHRLLETEHRLGGRDKEITELKDSVRDGAEAVSRLELQLREANGEVASLREQVAGIELERDSLKTDVKRHLSDAQLASAKLDAASEENSRFRVQCASLEADVEGYRKEAQSASTRVEELVEEHDRLRVQCASLEADVEGYRKEAQSASMRAEALEEEHDRLRVQCASLEAGVARHRNKAESASMRAEALEDENGRLRIQCDALEGEKHRLLADASGLKTRLDVSETLYQSAKARVDQFSDLLRERDDEVADLTVSHAAHQIAIDTHRRDAARVEGELTAKVGQLEDAVAAANRSLEEQSRLRGQDCQAALDSLVRFFVTTFGLDVQWEPFARAVQAPELIDPEGSAPEAWVLDVWDIEDDIVHEYPAQVQDLYAALCRGTWSASVLAQIQRFAVSLAHADRVSPAVVRVLLGEATRVAKSLDARSPTACACGLGLLQLVVALQTRWPPLRGAADDVVHDLTSVLASPIVDLIVRGDIGQSSDCLEHGHITLVSQTRSRVGFVVDQNSRFIRAVSKTRCGWTGTLSVTVYAPVGQEDLTISINSPSTYAWLTRNWVEP